MSSFTALGPGEEFDAIRELLARWGDAASGIGDDAAVLDVPRGDQLVASTDACVENRHFRPEWLTPEEIAYRGVMAAMSDLAAMAARPIAILWAVNLPDRWRARLPALADGARQAAVAAGARIVGGNIAASNELSLTTTVLGSAFKPLRREGAKVGDRLYVTGLLGGPGEALAAFLGGRAPDAAHRARFARPAARLAESRWLNERGVTAGIDVSDGLVGDASHLAAASGIGVRMHLERLPLIGGANALAAARSGEEYELLVTAKSIDTVAFHDAFGVPITEIGEVTDGKSVEVFDRGRPAEVGGGHDHFR